jgi:hypothetical protein
MNWAEKRAALLKAAQELVEKVKGESRDFTDDEQDTFDGIKSQIEEGDAREAKAAEIDTLVAKLAGPVREPGSDPEPAVVKGDLAERFVKSGAFTAWRSDNPSGVSNGTPVRIEAKGVGGLADIGLMSKATEYGSTTNPIDMGNASSQYDATQRLPGYRSTLVDFPLSFLDFITTGTTASSYLEYARIVAETDNAAIVAEGAAKPRSTVETDTADAKAFTYADGFDVTNQTLADDGALVAFMRSRLQRHIRSCIENVLLNGDSASGEPDGVLNVTGTKSQAWDTDMVTTLAGALATLEGQGGDPQAIVMHPDDIWTLRLLKDGQSNYALGNPLKQGLTATPFGVPLVPSRKLTAGTALVGDFSGVQFLQREALNILVFNQHKDYAEKNKSYVRAELRGMQLIYEPNRIVVTTVTSGSST